MQYLDNKGLEALWERIRRQFSSTAKVSTNEDTQVAVDTLNGYDDILHRTTFSTGSYIHMYCTPLTYGVLAQNVPIGQSTSFPSNCGAESSEQKMVIYRTRNSSDISGVNLFIYDPEQLQNIWVPVQQYLNSRYGDCDESATQYGYETTDAGYGVVQFKIEYKGFAQTFFQYGITFWEKQISTKNDTLIWTVSDNGYPNDNIHIYMNTANMDLTGTPTAPTAAIGTSTKQIATTAFVDAAVSYAITAALPSAITATTTSSSTLSLSAGTITQVPLTTMTGAVTTYLSISSGGVRCAKAGYVRVSGSAYVSPTSWESCNYGVYIKKGTAWSSSTEELSGWFYTAGYGGAVSVAPKIIYVSAGTIIWLAARCSVAGTCDQDNKGTYLTVEYVK